MMFKNKDKDNAESILLINEQMAIFISAYNALPIKCSEDADTEEKAWATSTYDEKDIIKRTGIRQRTVGKLFEIAKNAGIIYPDGYVNSSALKYVQLLVKKKVREAT